MSAHRTRAYVVKTQAYRDTSLLATFYTEDAGNIKAIVKGGRDSRARYGSTLEPFSLNEIILYRRKRGDLHLVTGVDLIDRYDALRRDLETLAQAAYMTELIDQLTEENQHPQDIFRLLQDALAFMMRLNSPRRAARIFEAKLMHELGFLSNLSRCARCGQTESGTVYFSIGSGGAICHDCRMGEGPLVSMSRGALFFLIHATQKSFEQMESIKVTLEVGKSVQRVMRQFVDYHLRYRPKSLTFLEKIGV